MGETDRQDDPGIGELLAQLAGDARGVAHAEITLAKARGNALVARYRVVAIFFAVAGTLALAALIALLVGLILTLTPHLGPGWSTLIVTVVTMTIVAILGLLGRRRMVAP